jgi:hypothetical protein
MAEGIVETKVLTLLDHPFFYEFINSENPDNAKYLENLKVFSNDMMSKGFSKKELEMLHHLTYLSTVRRELRIKKLKELIELELASETITFKLIKNPFDKDLKKFYTDVYQRIFPESEQEDLINYRRWIFEESFPRLFNFFYKNEYREKIDSSSYLVIVKVKGVVVGGIVFFTVNTKRISFTVIDYIVVYLDHLKEMPGLEAYSKGKWRIKIASALLNKCKSYSIPDSIKYGPGHLSFIMAEVNNPIKMYHHGILDQDITNPASRIRLYSQIGFRFLDFPWIQPSLSGSKKEIDYLYLIFMSFSPQITDHINPKYLEYVLMTYLATWKGINTRKNETVLKMKRELQQLKLEHKSVSLLTYQKLGITPEVIKACNSIRWAVNSINN